MRQLTRSRKWKHKEGRITSHSYWSWTHSPRGDYSRNIREASMAMEGLPEVVPPSGRVTGQLLLAAPILKRRRRRYGEEFVNNRSILGDSSAGAKYRPKEGVRGPPGSQEASWHGPTPGRATRVPGPLVVALWPHFGFSGTLIFYIIFQNCLGTFNSRKT